MQYLCLTFCFLDNNFDEDQEYQLSGSKKNNLQNKIKEELLLLYPEKIKKKMLLAIGIYVKLCSTFELLEMKQNVLLELIFDLQVSLAGVRFLIFLQTANTKIVKLGLF